MTVGSGIGPDLLTFRRAGSARGLVAVDPERTRLEIKPDPSPPLPSPACEGKRKALYERRILKRPTAGGESHPALKTLRVSTGEPARAF
jgi:hypothetical protein